MERAGVFKSNQSQAVRLPKAVSLPATVKQVDIVVLGRSRLIAPAGEAWDSWFNAEGVTEDFMEARDQPDDQERESF
ncbi:antitoxin [Porticoccaceae bacterium]|nr:antitoxin [Porticoccaceae bacterium]